MFRKERLPDDSWRVIAVVAVVVNLVVNFLPGIVPLPEVSQVAHQYSSFFTPADYAFSIWGLIYLSFAVYAVYQLRGSKEQDPLCRLLARPFATLNMLSIVWIIVFRSQLMWASTVVIIAMLLLALRMLILVRDAILRDEYSNWVTVPFSLIAGWLSVATVANVASAIVYSGWQGPVLIQMMITIVLLFAVGVAGVWVCARCRDYIFPSVISWACVAIYVATSADFPPVAIAALLIAVMPFVWIAAVKFRIYSFRHRALANKLSF